MIDNYAHSITNQWKTLLTKLMLHGGRLDDPQRPSGSSREFIGYILALNPRSEMLVVSDERKPSLPWACMEVLWYLGLDNDVAPLLVLAPNYARFCEDGTTEAFGGYGRRLMHNVGHDMAVDGGWSQLGSAFEILKRDPNSRQAVVTLWDSQDLAMHGKRKDIPCTLTLQFFVRDGKLLMQTSMRSNDAWIGFIYDTFAYRVIQRVMADALGISVGRYSHVVGSMHLYERNMVAANRACQEPYEIGPREDGELEKHPAWKKPMSFDEAYDILFRSAHSDYGPLDQLFDGCAKRDQSLLSNLVAFEPENWFDLIIHHAALGSLMKLQEIKQ